MSCNIYHITEPLQILYKSNPKHTPTIISENNDNDNNDNDIIQRYYSCLNELARDTHN